MSKTKQFSEFIKRNGYYMAFVFCLAVLAVITIALVMAGNADNSIDVGGGTQIEEENNQNENNNQQTPPVEEPSNKPTVSVIEFIMPVKDATIIKDYVGASVVYNQTLGLYTGHKAIDFASTEGADVFCVYDGVIESIQTSKINGTTITIDHGNGLKSVYNSIEVTEHLQEGLTVQKGEVIGEVSDNNKTEYLDGAHLHFEVLKNGEKIDPTEYLIGENK